MNVVIMPMAISKEKEDVPVAATEKIVVTVLTASIVQQASTSQGLVTMLLV